MTDQNNKPEWASDGEYHHMLYWHMPIPGTNTGLFLSLGTLGLLAEVKYAYANAKGEWHQTIASFEFYCEELSEKGICPETVRLVKDTAIAIVRDAFLSKANTWTEDHDAVSKLGGAVSAWYCPYGKDAATFAKKHLMPNVTANLRKSDGHWHLSVDNGKNLLPVCDLDADTKSEAQLAADLYIREHPECTAEMEKHEIILTEQEMRHVLCSAAYGLGHGYYDGTRTADAAMDKLNGLLDHVPANGEFRLSFVLDQDSMNNRKGGN